MIGTEESLEGFPCSAGFAPRLDTAATLPKTASGKRNEMADGYAPGLPWSDIAASAYRAYAASTGNKNFRGEPMPAFADLPQPIRTAWEAAVRQTGYCLDVRMGGAAPDESVWAGWTPP